MTKNPYSKTDKAITWLNRQYARLFRTVTSFDELNVIEVSHEIYDEALKVTEQEAARLVKTVYDSNRENGTISAEEALSFVLTLMLAYNPVTKYVYRNEIDRKRARFAEGVLASNTPQQEVALAKRLLIAMNKQFADDVTFDAQIQAYKDDGVETVRWITAIDDRRCKVCASRHNKVYPIDKVPSKPHIHCRCYTERME